MLVHKYIPHHNQIYNPHPPLIHSDEQDQRTVGLCEFTLKTDLLVNTY